MITHAWGENSRTALAISINIGTVRSPRIIPPGPAVSPTDCQIPRRSGMWTSTAISSKVPGRMEITTKSAPVSASCNVSAVSYRHFPTASGRVESRFPMDALAFAASLSMSYRRMHPLMDGSSARSVMKVHAHPRDPPPI